MPINRAQAIVGHMMANDAYSQWLGIEVVLVAPGTCTLRLTVRPEMTNGFAIAHGGITYALADSALAFASNGYGAQAVSLETSISHTKPLFAGDVIEAHATEINRGNKTGLYEVRVTKGADLVAYFKGTVFITTRNWPEDL
jgi:acyl-CoA thioesterase